MKSNETAARLLNAAQNLVQERGYNAFSYKDLAEIIGIRTASIHYHFATKADLGQALMDRYLADLNRAVEAIDSGESTSFERLRKFIDLYRATESRGAICLCGSLASDRDTLPESLKTSVSEYLERSENWVAEQVAEGMRRGEFEFAGVPTDAAVQLLTGLQGGLILARAQGGRPLLDTIERVFFQTLGAEISDS